MSPYNDNNEDYICHYFVIVKIFAYCGVTCGETYVLSVPLSKKREECAMVAAKEGLGF